MTQPFNEDSRLAAVALQSPDEDGGAPPEDMVNLAIELEAGRFAVVDVTLVDHGACATTTHCMLCPHAGDHLGAAEHAGAIASLVERLAAALEIAERHIDPGHTCSSVEPDRCDGDCMDHFAVTGALAAARAAGFGLSVSQPVTRPDKPADDHAASGLGTDPVGDDAKAEPTAAGFRKVNDA